MARTEVRKECPSCGLGVPLDAKVCEFCGWDFEEEDEWISQIEQLEAELISEKQKTDTAKVDRMIKSTLRSPVREKPPVGPVEKGKPIPITIKKKVPSKREEEIEVAEEPAEEAIEGPPTITVKTSRPVAPSKAAISIKVGAHKEEIPPPPEEFEARRPIAREGMVYTPEPGKKVRRVVKAHPKAASVATRSMMKASSSEPRAIPSTKNKTAGVKTLSSTVTPAKIEPATKPPPAMPAETEKKGFFSGLGKMFSMETTEKESKPAPGKQTPSKPASEKLVQKAPEKKEPAPEAKPAPTVRVFVCPLCNAEVKETERTCPNCGAEFE